MVKFITIIFSFAIFYKTLGFIYIFNFSLDLVHEIPKILVSFAVRTLYYFRYLEIIEVITLNYGRNRRKSTWLKNLGLDELPRRGPSHVLALALAARLHFLLRLAMGAVEVWVDRRAVVPVRLELRVVVVLFASILVLGNQVGCADAVGVTLRSLQLLLGVDPGAALVEAAEPDRDAVAVRLGLPAGHLADPADVFRALGGPAAHFAILALEAAPIGGLLGHHVIAAAFLVGPRSVVRLDAAVAALRAAAAAAWRAAAAAARRARRRRRALSARRARAITHLLVDVVRRVSAALVAAPAVPAAVTPAVVGPPTSAVVVVAVAAIPARLSSLTVVPTGVAATAAVAPVAIAAATITVAAAVAVGTASGPVVVPVGGAVRSAAGPLVGAVVAVASAVPAGRSSRAGGAARAPVPGCFGRAGTCAVGLRLHDLGVGPVVAVGRLAALEKDAELLLVALDLGVLLGVLRLVRLRHAEEDLLACFLFRRPRDGAANEALVEVALPFPADGCRSVVDHPRGLLQGPHRADDDVPEVRQVLDLLEIVSEGVHEALLRAVGLGHVLLLEHCAPLDQGVALEAFSEEGEELGHVGGEVGLVEPRLDFFLELRDGENQGVFGSENAFVGSHFGGSFARTSRSCRAPVGDVKLDLEPVRLAESGFTVLERSSDVIGLLPANYPAKRGVLRCTEQIAHDVWCL